MIAFYEAANLAIERTASSTGREAGGEGGRITYNVIKNRLGDLIYKLSSQKFEDPAEGEEALKRKFKAIHEEIRERFRSLEEEYRWSRVSVVVVNFFSLLYWNVSKWLK